MQALVASSRTLSLEEQLSLGDVSSVETSLGYLVCVLYVYIYIYIYYDMYIYIHIYIYIYT